MICPLLRRLIAGNTQRIIFAVPKKFTSNWSRKFQSLISSTAPTNAIISRYTTQRPDGGRDTFRSSVNNNINPTKSFFSFCNRRLTKPYLSYITLNQSAGFREIGRQNLHNQQMYMREGTLRSARNLSLAQAATQCPLSRATWAIVLPSRFPQFVMKKTFLSESSFNSCWRWGAGNIVVSGREEIRKLVWESWGWGCWAEEEVVVVWKAAGGARSASMPRPWNFLLCLLIRKAIRGQIVIEDPWIFMYIYLDIYLNK